MILNYPQLSTLVKEENQEYEQRIYSPLYQRGVRGDLNLLCKEQVQAAQKRLPYLQDMRRLAKTITAQK